MTALCVYRDVSGLFCGQVAGAEINVESESTDHEHSLKLEHIKRCVLLFKEETFTIVYPTMRLTKKINKYIHRLCLCFAL